MNVAKEWMMLVVATVAMCAGATQPNQCPVTSPDGICTNIPYADRAGCELDLYIPQGVSNFPVVVWFHGGGLTGGHRKFLPLVSKDIAQATVEYRLLGKGAKTGVDCIEDAAAAVAWTMKNISRYGGNVKKVYVSGMSAGGYLTMMVGMDPKYLAAHGIKTTDLAGIIPISGQATKHFNVRKYAGDKDPKFLPKIDELAPLAHVSANIPPILSVCGQPPLEWKCRSEENWLLIASCVALGHKNAKFVQLDYCNHGRAYTAGLPYLEMFIQGKLNISKSQR
jgi:acetyl esterase/lipase